MFLILLFPLYQTGLTQRPQLLGLYMIIALAFWASPPDALQKFSS